MVLYGTTCLCNLFWLRLLRWGLLHKGGAMREVAEWAGQGLQSSLFKQ